MKLITWNIQWGRGCDNIVDLDRISNLIKNFDGIDFICLQEVSVNHNKLPGLKGENQVQEFASIFPKYYIYYEPENDLLGENGKRMQVGNCILSKYPALQIFRHNLPFYNTPGVPCMPRVALEIVVSIGKESLRVITTHLEYYSLPQRLKQIEYIRNIHEEAFSHFNNFLPNESLDSPFKMPLRPIKSVYCGDFNCEPNSDELSRLLKPFDSPIPNLKDAWSILNPNLDHAYTVGLHECSWPDKPYCCDYFFISENLSANLKAIYVDQNTSASDHQPVILDFEI